MNRGTSPGEAFERLREKAEELLKEGGRQIPDPEREDLLRLTHELEVYYIELGLQNQELLRAKAEVEEARNEFADLYDFAPVAYLTLNEKDFIQRANKATLRMLDKAGGFLLGSSFSSRLHVEDVFVYSSLLKQVAFEGEGGPVELRLRGENNKTIYVQVTAAGREVQEHGGKQYRLALVDITGRKWLEEELRRSRDELELRVAELSQKTDQLSRLSFELTLVEQRERRRLAVLIHDHIQQMLVGAKIGLELMTKRLKGADQKKSQEICDLVVGCLKTARTLNAQLSPTILYERGLGSALKWLAETMQETYELEVKTQIDSDTDVEREEMKVLIFESVRELLFNVIKHAGVASARLEVSRDDGDRLRITVRDQGVGFDPDRMLKDLGENHFGLFSIRERLELIGGSLQIESSPGHGAAFSLIFPMVGILGPEEASKEVHGISPAQAAAASTQAGEKIRVLLVDDHVVMRQGLSSLLSQHSDIEIAGEAADGEEAVQLARTLQPDVILMDISMPRMNGIDATRVIHSESPRVRTIGLSMYDDAETEKGMRDAGAVAFLNKGGHSDALVAAIRQSIRHV